MRSRISSRILGLGLIIANLFICVPRTSAAPTASERSRFFYSERGREHEVFYDSVYRTKGVSLRNLLSMSEEQRRRFVDLKIVPVTDYLFGPLTRRSIGGTKKLIELRADWAAARETRQGIEIPYSYRGQWILERKISESGSFDIPVPFNTEIVFSSNWKKCTDSDPEHQTPGFYWYFWDPQRYGCDQKEGNEYSTVMVRIGDGTPNNAVSYPEYDRLIRNTANGRELKMTIAFGYVEDQVNANPDRANNTGMHEYQIFLDNLRRLLGSQFEEQKILKGEYKNAWDPERLIGHRFRGNIQGLEFTINVVTSTSIDQMELFAKSFAHDHDGVFAWFGHSRVGSGFDAERFERMLRDDPDYYSVSNEYQIIYWGGCNSYSYYTLPFFALKAEAGGEADPNGTRNLDIIANGLPSFFVLNSSNAMILTKALLRWQERPSYQEIIGGIERAASRLGGRVLSAVLGDEDNP